MLLHINLYSLLFFRYGHSQGSDKHPVAPFPKTEALVAGARQIYKHTVNSPEMLVTNCRIKGTMIFILQSYRYKCPVLCTHRLRDRRRKLVYHRILINLIRNGTNARSRRRRKIIQASSDLAEIMTGDTVTHRKVSAYHKQSVIYC